MSNTCTYNPNCFDKPRNGIIIQNEFYNFAVQFSLSILPSLVPTVEFKRGPLLKPCSHVAVSKYGNRKKEKNNNL